MTPFYLMLIILGLAVGIAIIYFGISKYTGIVKKPVLVIPVILGLAAIFIITFYMPMRMDTVKAQHDHLKYEINQILGTERLTIYSEKENKLEVYANNQMYVVYTDGEGKAEEIISITEGKSVIYYKDKIKNDLN